MKILVTDDSRSFLAMVTETLKSFGHSVIAATSGEEAIRLYVEEKPDLIILDVVMEGMDGFECARCIREIEREEWIPIIFLSASVDDKSIASGIEAGGDDYLTKPFSEITLDAKVRAMQRISDMRKKMYQTSQELKLLSSTDPLTGLYNRREFERRINEKIAEADRHHLKVALFYIDLDHFKTINDSLGHRLGDQLLVEVAKRIRDSIRAEDFAARLGGDEFVVMVSLLRDISILENVANKLIKSIAPVYYLGGNSIRVTASVGVACYPDSGRNSLSFMQCADIAMYHAKELGRNNFQFYSNELDKTYRKQINLEQKLKFAIERNELYLVYQPITWLATGKLYGMEVLLRWKHPEFGNISPNIFIPIAENTGMIQQIGAWVFKKACIQGQKWRKQGLGDFMLAVNISLHQFVQENFFKIVTEILRKSGFPANCLEMEITETAILNHKSHLRETLIKLHDMGVRIGIDDFGTKYSFLSSLRYLPVDTIKIDRMFLKSIETDFKNRVIVNSLVALGNSLEMHVIAEGVQTEKQREFLLANECELGQGYLFGRAMRAAAMTRLMEKEKSDILESGE